MWAQPTPRRQLPDRGDSEVSEGSQKEEGSFFDLSSLPGLFWKGAPGSHFGKQPAHMIPQGPGYLSTLLFVTLS